MLKSEVQEIIKKAEERKVGYETLIWGRVEPLQERISEISRYRRELIGAIVRYQDRGPRETLYAGVITPTTKFPSNGDSGESFLLEVDKAHYLDLSSPFAGFKKDGNFKNPGDRMDRWTLLYFMDKPPAGTLSSNPRLELYIGDDETIPFLEERLEGWRYVQLSKLLDDDNLPISERVLQRVEEEQLDIFDEIREAERQMKSLTEERERRLEIVRGTESLIHRGAYVEISDEVAERLRFNPQIKEIRRKVVNLARTAVKRGYHETGMDVKREVDVGVEMHIDLKEFFKNRKILFNL